MHQISSGTVLLHVVPRSLELCQYLRGEGAAGVYERRVDGLTTPCPLRRLAGTDTMPMKMNENICIESRFHQLEALQHLCGNQALRRRAWRIRLGRIDAVEGSFVGRISLGSQTIHAVAAASTRPVLCYHAAHHQGHRKCAQLSNNADSHVRLI